MREKTPKDYADELLKLYREKGNAQKSNLTKGDAIPTAAPTKAVKIADDGTGGLMVNATTLRGIYPVEGALVTVFTGEGNNMEIIEMDTTDQSGKSKIFTLKTPARAESLLESNNKKPYASYNVSVRSDGFIEQIAMNIPVFSGVVSQQSIDLVKNTVAGKNNSPQIIQGGNNYNL